MQKDQQDIMGFPVELSTYLQENSENIQKEIMTKKKKIKLTPTQKRDWQFSLLKEAIENNDSEVVKHIWG